MDREIGFAADGGLDYWAFLIYPESSSMSVALKLYLSSSQRERIKFCVILHNTLNSSAEQWPAERDRAVALLKEPSYQTVLDGRPLVYAFKGGRLPFGRFLEFRRAAKEAGLDPYCVFMGWNPANDFERVSSKGFDAVSAYAKGGDQATFAELVESVERDCWQNAAEASVPYVPFVTMGWDKRPRQDHPVSWEKGPRVSPAGAVSVKGDTAGDCRPSGPCYPVFRRASKDMRGKCHDHLCVERAR